MKVFFTALEKPTVFPFIKENSDLFLLGFIYQRRLDYFRARFY